jgi:hypothetical protein
MLNLRRLMELTMRKLVIAAAVGLLAGLLTLRAEALALTSALPAPAVNHTLVERAGCGGPGDYCPYGYLRKCGPYGCGCKPCNYGPRLYKYPYKNPYKYKRYYGPY